MEGAEPTAVQVLVVAGAAAVAAKAEAAAVVSIRPPRIPERRTWRRQRPPPRQHHHPVARLLFGEEVSWASHAVLAGYPYQPRVRSGRGLVPALRAISFGLRKPVYVEVWVRRYHHQAQGRSGRGPKPAPAPAPPLTSPFKWIRSLLIAHQPAPLLTPPPRPRHPLRHPPRHPPPPPPPPLLRPSP